MYRGQIGTGLIIRHSNGIVIGGGAIIGNNCTLLQQVTLGEMNGDGADVNHTYPVIHDNVVINAGAKLIGGITIGSDVIIGANAVVLGDIPPRMVAVGVPARIVGERKNQ